MSITSEAVDFIRYRVVQDKIKGWWNYDPFIKDMKKSLTIVDINEEYDGEHHVIIIDTNTVNGESIIKKSFEKHTKAHIKKEQEKDQADFEYATEHNKKGKPECIKGDEHLEEMFEQIAIRWKHGDEYFDKEDYDMAAMCYADAHDLHELAQLYHKGDLNAAQKLCFDTCVRERIPEGIYRWMRQE